MKRETAVALVCAAIAFSVGTVAARWAASPEGQITRLVRMSEGEPMADVARASDPGFAFASPEGHYDGVYFYAIAHDPFATEGMADRIDFAAYRYGHPGYGWVAGVLSLGVEARIPHAMLVAGLLGMAVAAYCSSLISVHLRRTPWAGLFVVANPGILYALISLTSETVAVAFLAASVLFYLRERVWPAVACLTALALIKEPFVLVAAGLGLWEFLQRGERSRLSRSLPFAIPGVALAAWFVYLKWRFGLWSFLDGPENLTTPFRGWGDAFRMAADMTFGAFESGQLGSASFPLLAAVAVALLAGMATAIARPTALGIVFGLQVLLIACASWLVLLYPKDMVRNVAIPIALLPAVLAGDPLARSPHTGIPHPRDEGAPGQPRAPEEQSH